MQKISLIAAVDEHYGIGKDNQLLCHLPADLKRFKELTLGKPIIMGRKTYHSIGKPLPGRQNIVLSSQRLKFPGVETVTSLEAALQLTADVGEIMIIGGEAVFREALPIATDIFLTLIQHQFNADVFFPSFNKNDWRCIECLEKRKDEKNGYDLLFCHYQRR